MGWAAGGWLGWWDRVDRAALGAGLGAVVCQTAWGAEDETQLLAELVEREAHHIQEVSVYILHQHTTQSLDTIATSLVPVTHTHTERPRSMHTQTETQQTHTSHIN